MYGKFNIKYIWMTLIYIYGKLLVYKNLNYLINSNIN